MKISELQRLAVIWETLAALNETVFKPVKPLILLAALSPDWILIGHQKGKSWRNRLLMIDCFFFYSSACVQRMFLTFFSHLHASQVP